MYSGSWLAPATSTRLSTRTGGIAAPEPSKTVARGSSAAHGDYAGFEAFTGEQARQVARDRRLPNPLARPDHGQRRLGRDGTKIRGLQFEVATEVARPGVEGERGYLHPLSVADYGLVGEVDDNVDLVVGERLLYSGDGVCALDERDAVVRAIPYLLRAPEEGRCHTFGSQGLMHALHSVDHDGRIVLAIDQEQRPHGVLAQRSPLATVLCSAIALDLFVMQVLVGRRVEVHDQLAVLERILAEDPHPAVFDLDDVVAGARVTP